MRHFKIATDSYESQKILAVVNSTIQKDKLTYLTVTSQDVTFTIDYDDIAFHNIIVIRDTFFSTGVVTFNILNFNLSLNATKYKFFKLVNTSTTANVIISTDPVLMYNINGIPQFGSTTYTMTPSTQVGFEFINSNFYVSIN